MKETRLEIIQSNTKKGRAEETGLPTVLPAGRHLIDALLVLGPIYNNGTAFIPTGWDRILPFSQATGRISEPWEFEVLHDMCRAYHHAWLDGVRPLALAPSEQPKGSSL